MRFLKRDGILCFGSFSCWRQKKSQNKNKPKGKLLKNAQKKCFGVGGKSGYAKSVFWKNAKHHLCLEGGNKGIFVNTICFGKIVLFQVLLTKRQKHYKNWGFQHAQWKLKVQVFFEKGVFLERVLWKAVYYL